MSHRNGGTGSPPVWRRAGSPIRPSSAVNLPQAAAPADYTSVSVPKPLNVSVGSYAEAAEEAAYRYYGRGKRQDVPEDRDQFTDIPPEARVKSELPRGTRLQHDQTLSKALVHSEQTGDVRLQGETLADSLAHLLDEAVEGPIARAFQEIERRFSEVANVNRGLVRKVAILEERNAQAEERSAQAERRHQQMTADLVRKHELWQDELNTMMRQLSMFVHSMDSTHASEIRQRQQSQLKSTIVQLQRKGLVQAWTKWKEDVQRTKRKELQLRRAAKRFRNKTASTCIDAWAGWVRNEHKRQIDEQMGLGTVDTFARLEEKLEQELGKEVTARHHEVAEIHKVMKQMHETVMLQESTFRAIESTRILERVRRIDSIVWSATLRLRNKSMSIVWHTWKKNGQTLKRDRNMLRKAGSRIAFRTLAKCFDGLRHEAVLSARARQETQLHKMREVIKRIQSVGRKTTISDEQIQAVVAEATEAYYMLEQEKRKTLIERYIRRAFANVKHKLMRLGFDPWRKFVRDELRRRRLMAKASSRLFLGGMVKCFRPWASRARWQVKTRNEATTASNYAAVQKLKVRLDGADAATERIKAV